MKIIYAQIALAVVISTAAGDANRAKSKQNSLLSLFKREASKKCIAEGGLCDSPWIELK